jgi:hypothetical protein
MTPGKMTVAQLREALAAKGMDTSGLKAALVARMEEANAGGDDPTGASARSRTRLCRRRGEGPTPNVDARADDGRTTRRDRRGRSALAADESATNRRPRPDATPLVSTRASSRARVARSRPPRRSPRPSSL